MIKNTQHAYEQMREYFSHPNAKLAKTKSGTCLYRTDDGRKCALGCLIPDDLYDPAFEGEGSWTLLGEHDTLHSQNTIDPETGEDIGIPLDKLHEYFSKVDADFIKLAQSLHDDSAHNAEHFVELLDNLAREAELVVPA